MWQWYFVVVLTARWLVSFEVFAAYDLPVNELKALEYLYNSTNGETWNWRATGGVQWTFSSDAATQENPCTSNWQGILCTSTCSTSQCHIKEISLADYNLDGTLPPQLSSLTYMQYLYLDGNKLFGSLPSSWTKLTSLLVCSITNNNLNGTLPSGYDSWLSVQEIQLFNNALYGPLPSSWSKLSDLQTLKLNNNRFTGSIPASYASLKSLSILALESNRLNGSIASDLSRLTRLTTFYLYSNHLTGSIPPQLIRNMTSLVNFNLGANALQGSLPNDFFEWSPALQTVNVYGNNLTGTLPSSLQKLSDLLYLDVSHNNMTGSLPTSLIESWPQIEQFYVEYNHFHGTMPPQLGKLTKLQKFSAEANRFSGSIPTFSWPSSTTVVGNSHSGYSTTTNEVYAPLQQLLLSQNRFTGPLPATLPHTMQYADFSLNQLNGTLPKAYSNLSALTYLSAFRNRLTGSLPAAWSSSSSSMASSLSSVILNDNALTGSFPGEWRHWTALTELSLHNNRLTGTLPPQLCSPIASTGGGSITNNDCFPALVTLSIASNYFEGPLPTWLTSLSTLVSFAVSGNRFNGSLPTFVSAITGAPLTTTLTTLYLQNNSFSGSIPSSWGTLTTLQDVKCDRNRLTGTVPPSLLALRNVRVLNVAHNAITGTLRLNDSTAATGDTPEVRTCGWTLVSFAFNRFAGPLDERLFATCTPLEEINLAGNAFSGPLPTVLTNCSATATETALPSLRQLLLSDNRFNGSLPCLRRLPSLATLDAADNAFSGDLSPLLQPLNATSGLLSLNVANNRLTGRIPSDLFAAWQSSLLTFNVSANALTGSWSSSSSWSLPATLRFLDVSHNGFTGSIASSVFASVADIVFVYLHHNAFTGPITNVFPLATTAATTATTTATTTAAYASLLIVDVDHNHFTGRFPLVNGSFAALQSLVLASNCLTTSQTVVDFDGLCGVRPLTSLVLDGASSHCLATQRPMDRVSRQTWQRQDALPACLVQSLAWQTFHVSGLQLTGSLPPLSATAAQSLAYFSVSHNALTGHLSPTYLATFDNATVNATTVRQEWDVSFNRFTGELPPFTPSTVINTSVITLQLQLNRLSHRLPAAYLTVDHIAVLQGNLFACDAHLDPATGTMSRTLPSHDAQARSYTCGSQNVDAGMLFWAAWCGTVVVTATALLVVLCWRHHQRRRGDGTVIVGGTAAATAATAALETMQRLLDWWSVASSPVAAALFAFLDDDDDDDDDDDSGGKGGERRRTAAADAAVRSVFRRGYVSFWRWASYMLTTLWVFVGGLCLVLVPMYMALTRTFGTYTTQFVWTLSACFLQGPTPVAVLTVTWLLLWVVFLVHLRQRDGWTRLQRRCVAWWHGRRRPRRTTTSLWERLTRFVLPAAAVSKSPPNDPAAVVDVDWPHRWGRRLALATALVVDASVVLALNGGYVYLTRPDQTLLSAAQLNALTVAFALVKIGLNFLLNAALRWAQQRRQRQPQPQGHGHRHAMDGSVWLVVAVSVFNNVVAPIVAELLVSPNCFYYASLATAPSVTSSLPLPQCTVIANDDSFLFERVLGTVTDVQVPYVVACSSGVRLPSTIASTATAITGASAASASWSMTPAAAVAVYLPPIWRTVAYAPTFQYSFACSSSLVTTFVWVYVVRYLWTGLCAPVVYAVLAHCWYRVTLHSDGGNGGSGNRGRWMRPLLALATPAVWRTRPEALLTSPSSPSSPSTIASQENPLHVTKPPTAATVTTGTLPTTAAAVVVPDEEATVAAVFSGHQLLVSWVTDVLLLLTFGVAFPPLGLLIVWNMTVQLTTYQLAVGRWLCRLRHAVTMTTKTTAATRGVSPACLASVSRVFRRIGDSLRQTTAAWRWLTGYVAWFTLWFWTFLLVDTLGSTSANGGAGYVHRRASVGRRDVVVLLVVLLVIVPAAWTLTMLLWRLVIVGDVHNTDGDGDDSDDEGSAATAGDVADGRDIEMVTAPTPPPSST